MAQTHLREAKIAVFGALALLSFLALCLRGLPKLAAVLKWACSSAKPAVPRDALWHAVSEKMLANKVRQYRCLMLFFCLLSLTGALTIVLHLILEKERWHSRVQDAFAVALPLLTVPAFVFPKVINSRTIDAHFVLMMLLFTMNVSPFAASARLTAPLAVSNISVAALNITRRSVATQKLPLLLVCNALFAISASRSISKNGRAHLAFIPEAVAAQVVFISLVALGAHALETTFTATLRHGLQLEEAKELHGAACALLRSFCECTVELDEEGVITEDQQDFCSFLMRGSLRSLTGKRFADFLSDGDREAFEERLRGPRLRKVGLAEALPVTLRDAYGNPLRLELSWFDFKKVDGRRNFMVGIRELTDCRPGDLAPLPADAKPEEVAEVTSTNADAAILVVNAMEADFPIQGHSRGLEVQVGKLPRGASLATFVKKPERFLPWVQRAALEEAAEKVEVTLLMPYGKFRARCCVVKNDAGLEALGLLFTRITAAGHRRPSLGLGTPNSVSSEGSAQAVSL